MKLDFQWEDGEKINSPINCIIPIIWSVNEFTIVIGSRNHSIQVCNLLKKTSTSLVDHKGSVTCLVQMIWDLNDTTVISGSEDKTLKVWNIQTKKVIWTLSGHPDKVHSLIQLNITQEKNLILSGCIDGFRLWDIGEGVNTKYYKKQNFSPGCMIKMNWSLNENTFIVGMNKNIEKWEISFERLVGNEMFEHTNFIFCLIQMEWSRDETTIISGSSEGLIIVWDIVGEKQLRSLIGHLYTVVNLVQIKRSCNESTIASTSADKTLRFWDVIEGTNLLTIKSSDYVSKLLFMNWNRNEVMLICVCYSKLKLLKEKAIEKSDKNFKMI